MAEALRKKNELMDKLMNLTDKEKIEVYVNKLKFYGEKKRVLH